MNKDQTPVTILTGFLGAGKTTLLNRILTEEHGLKIAVIENEFGEVGVDHELVISADEEIFEMNNGCVCCTVRGDLIRILGNLMKRRAKFDHILIETTGLADPGPVVQTFFADVEMREKLFVNGVVTLVDAKHVLLHLDDSEEVAGQIAFADLVLLNKCDLVGESDIEDLECRIRQINALATIRRTEKADIPVAEVLGIGGFNLDHAMEVAPHFLEEGHHHHHSDVTSIGIECEGDCDERRLDEWLSRTVREQGRDIFRMKGVFAIKGHSERVIFQGVHMIMDVASGGSWGRRPRQNILVFIGRNLDREALTTGFRSCLA